LRIVDSACLPQAGIAELRKIKWVNIEETESLTLADKAIILS
jgi:hypothetical protein